MLRRIITELKEHAPFTAFGAITGIIVMVILVLGNVPSQVSQTIFYTLHPMHVVLSAVATTAMYRRYSRGNIWVSLLVGYVGSVGIATLSDAIIPYLEGVSFNLSIEFHLPFIEEWWLVNPLALIGIAVGYWKRTTKVPHWGHVMLSTWASLFYFAAFASAAWLPLLPIIFLFLFIAVILPCCLSDIVFPLLFIGKGLPARGG